MTISSSLNAGVSGLAANASRLSTISDNIANSSTNGYKNAVTDFHSMVASNGTGSYSAGGVRVTNQRLIDQSGALLTTDNSTDLAIRGRGFLPVTDSSAIGNENGSAPMYLATTGSFRADSQGYLQTSTGTVLLGWPASADGTVATFSRDTAEGLEPVQVNVNSFAGQPTENMSLGVNLPATETVPGASGDALELSIEYFDNLGISRNVLVSFEPDVSLAAASNTWQVTLRDSASSNAIVGQYDVVFDATRGAGGSIDSVALVAGQPGSAFNAVDGTVTIQVAGGPIEVELGIPNGTSGLTQLSDSFAPTQITKDGSPVGNLVSVDVDSNGFVQATFDIGITRTIYQIPLVDIPNPNGLLSLDNQTYSTSPDSGSFFLWDASNGPTGDIVSFALEESATDVADELTNLIQTQRAYSSNAKVIQTVDEMLQETTNIKR
ncbi:MAG: flagellar hook-basal body complex protein [Litoreibacter sp.]